jgi:hypothetical protein
MILKDLLFFLTVCGLAGFCIVLGSVLGHSLGRLGLFTGAVIGGIAGVAAAVWLTARLRLLDRASFKVTFLSGVVGFIIAAVIAVNNLHGPLVPIASVALIGVGALIGKRLGHKRQS